MAGWVVEAISISTKRPVTFGRITSRTKAGTVTLDWVLARRLMVKWLVQKSTSRSRNGAGVSIRQAQAATLSAIT